MQAVKKCKCGSNTHQRTNHDECPLNPNRGRTDLCIRWSHPSGHKSIRLQKMWEGVRGIMLRTEYEKRFNKRLYHHKTNVIRNPNIIPDGLKWADNPLGIENNGVFPGRWVVFFSRPSALPPKDALKRGNVIWDEFSAMWVKDCGCGGNESSCYGKSNCVCRR
jgi:hypothetical protein